MIVIETLMGQDLDLGTSTASKTAPGGGTLSGHQISLSTFALNGASTQATTSSWSPSAVSAGQSVTTTVTVTGAALGDFVLTSFSVSLANLILSAYVSATNTVTLVLSNPTSASITPTSGTAKVLVFRVR